MIHFEPLISGTWSWLFAAAIILILGVQLFWILNADLKTSRKVIKIALNALFSLLLLGYLLQPIWTSSKPEEAVLIHSTASTKEKVRFWKDSLSVKKSVDIRKFQGEGNPVYLLGSDFSEAELLKIGDRDIQWVSDIEDGALSFLDWKGILREGEMQTVNGRIESSESLKISISQQGEILAETISELNEGAFSLKFSAKVLGRNELDLMVNDSLYGSIKFFVRPAKPIQYSLQFAFPDAEIRVLTQYLINSGEKVQERIDVSKNSTISSGSSESDSLQFLIIDPAQLTKKSTQDAIENGASILVINLDDIGRDVPAINKAFETNFKAKRITTEESREVEADLEALPYELESVIAQKLLFENAFAVQQIGNAKVGVSLLGKTFPIKLAGDSLHYQAIWQKMLGAMIPQESGVIDLNQPVFTDMRTDIKSNQEVFIKDFVNIESDSVFLQQSLVNPFSKTAEFVSMDSGWVSIADSIEFYSYTPDEWETVRASKWRADFLKAHSKRDTTSEIFTSQEKVSDWLWFTLFVLTLTLLWLEPKLLK
ncbi:hypothetical protein [Algoriphagus aquimarinus]|uniref:Aerotolerance regulator N-terminal domain-containing protein n=1 Tax=Algoriphagus aquimarinus TaxID=237018 RepID=A0A1I0XKZ8_9BACT|nr:hypothetical protein [Algoriphagus aquimarinus]SFB00888.1 hypothetical protein SAMN04489723_103215 [Algoriphagus aquimarinus]